MPNQGVGFTTVDLFAGAGGFHIGFEQAGFRTLLATDFDPDVAKTHARNFPHIPFLAGDIRDLTESEIDNHLGGREVDVLVGGPPCQGFSTIGKRASSCAERRARPDDRNTLFLEYIRVLKHIRPKFFLMENVVGLLTMEKGKALAGIKEEFSKTEYSFEVFVLNAADYGVPQVRRRVFILGTRLDVALRPPVPSHDGDQVPYETVGSVIGDLASGSDLANHDPLKHGEINIARYKLIPEGGRLPEGALPKELYRKNFGNTFKRLHRGRPSLTMVPGHNAFPIHPWLHRSLTVREAARIQTFPDEVVFTGSRQRQCIQVGNAVPPVLARKWAEHIKLLLNEGAK